MNIRTIIAGLALLLGMQNIALADVRIGVAMTSFDDIFQTSLRKQVEARAREIPGVSLQFEDGRNDVVRQLTQVQSFISQKVDAIIVTPVDTSATRKITQAAVAAKIPLIYMNMKPDEPNLPAGVATVTSNEVQAGMLQMEFLAKRLGGKGNVAVVMGDLAHSASIARTKGVHEVLKQYPGMKVVEEQSALWQRDKAMDLMSNWLISGTRIDAVVANNDEMAIGAAMALAQAGKKGVVPVGGTDGTDQGLAAVKSGLLAVSVLQDAKGQAHGAVDAAVHMAKGEKVENLVLPFKLITKDNIGEFLAAQR